MFAAKIAQQRWRAPVLAVAGLVACIRTPSYEADVGGERRGCGEPDSFSFELSDHSCACEAGYTWCSEDLDDFRCCPDEGDELGDGGDAAPPDLPCGREQLEQLICVEDPDDPGPEQSRAWACNGERWIEAVGVADFECAARLGSVGFSYGCGTIDGRFVALCGFGDGGSCDVEGFVASCRDEDILDGCVWGRRTVDRCSRLCVELEAFGPGFRGGACIEDDSSASCVCCSDC